MTGWTAESWELPDNETLVFHIRHGVHWWNKPPTNGREVTADDVVWTINKAFSSPKCYFYTNFTAGGKAPKSVKALDKYTVEIKVPEQIQGMMLLEIGDRLYLFPPDVTNMYGDMSDWRNAIGTSAWMLSDYVQNSSCTFTRNPDYWQMDPLNPQNRLPYPDVLQTLSIQDTSTQISAFRTGKIDQLFFGWDDFKEISNQNSKLEYVQTFSFAQNILSGRVDKQDLPFKDIRVRQALNLAIDKKTMLEDYYEGKATMIGYPCPPVKDFEPYFIPLEEQPAEVQDLFTYNPEKAKQLLAEAGYPDGFSTNVICVNSGTAVDDLSIVREYFLDINVDMEIRPLETGVYMSQWASKSHEQMIWSSPKSAMPFMLVETQKAQMFNASNWESEKTTTTSEAIFRALGRDDEEVARLVRDITPYLLESAWGVWLPVPYTYTMWWPWLKNYYGAQDVGYNSQYRQYTFPWVDTDLKKSMGY